MNVCLMLHLSRMKPLFFPLDPCSTHPSRLSSKASLILWTTVSFFSLQIPVGQKAKLAQHKLYSHHFSGYFIYVHKYGYKYYLST